jgi:FtsX-like permease family/MacB-like periplasmic core domain
MRQLLCVAGYRIRATFASRWGGYLSLVLLIGLVGGVSMGAVAGARRTDSSFPVFLKSTNPSSLQVLAGFADPALGLVHGYSPRVIHALASMPFVEHSVTTVGFDGSIDLTSIKGVHLHITAGETPPGFIGGLGGEYLTQDRVTVVHGRIFAPSRPDEAVMNAQAAAEMEVHVGSVISFPIYTNADTQSSANTPPYRVVRVRLVGIVVFASSVVQSDIVRLGDGVVLLSPSLTRQLAPCCAYYSGAALILQGGLRHVAATQAEAQHVSPLAGVGVTGGGTPSEAITQAQRAIKPEAIALGVFGAIAGLAVLLIAAQLMGRLLRRGAGDAATLRALGADRAMAFVDVLVGLLCAVVLGSLVAGGVAVLLSPLMPIGPVRPVFPTPGFDVDWTVLGLGVVAVVVVLGGVAAFLTRRETTHLASRGPREQRRQEGRVVRAAANSGLSVPAVTGLRLAVDPGTGRGSVPVRSAILGAVLAVTVLVGTVTFGASLNALVSHPALYGWNWDDALLSGFAGQEDLPQAQVTRLFDKDRYVEAWSGVNFVSGWLDGQGVSLLAEHPGAAVAPPLLSGHGLVAANQVVLGRTTLAALHAEVGDVVALRVQGKRERHLVIVGTATFPAISKGFAMGIGALVATSDFPIALLDPQQNPIPGPNAVLVRLRPGASAAAERRSLLVVEAGIDATKGDEGSSGGYVHVLRPAEIVNYRAMGTTPALLGLALAFGAVVALGLTLLTSVRRRRRDLAMLKTLGFTQRQLAAAVAWQSSVAVLVGIALGVPLGIALGHVSWDLFARELDAVPQASVPAQSILVIAFGALVLANLVAAIPGRMAARTPTALILRAE